MAFTIGFKPIPIPDITGLKFLDTSTGDETITGRSIVITKPDLTTVEFDFPNNTDSSISPTGFLDKDYALEATFTVVTNANQYVQTLRFVTLGYTIKARLARSKRAKVDRTIIDIDEYNKTTYQINEYALMANDRVAFSDIDGAQEILDFIADLISREALSPFSV